MNFFYWKLGEVITFRDTIIQKLTKIFGLKKDDDFLGAKLVDFITIRNEIIQNCNEKRRRFLKKLVEFITIKSAIIQNFNRNFGLKNDDDFFKAKLIEFITLKNIIIRKIYQFTEHFSLLLAFSYLLPVPVYVVRVPPLPHRVCCVSTVHCRPAGTLLSLCVCFAVFLDGRGFAIDVGDGRIIIRGRSSSRNSTKTPPMKRKKTNKKDRQTEASKGSKEGMQQKGGNIVVLVSSVCCSQKQTVYSRCVL